MTDKSYWENYTEMCDHIASIRPGLAAEAKTYSTRPAADFSTFLSEHFPIPGGWNTQSIDTASQTLKRHYPAK